MGRDVEYFESRDSVQSAIQQALSWIVRAEQQNVASRFLSQENILHYHHASSWSNPANDFSPDGEMEEHRAEYSISFQRIIEGDLTVLSDSIGAISEQMEAAFMRTMVGVMNEACDKSGNIVKGADIAEGFLQALEKIELSVGVDGKIELPQVLTGNDNLFKAISSQPPEFGERIERLKARKAEEAIEKERQRLSKFRSG